MATESVLIPEYLSYSAVGDLSQCGELFRLGRILKVPKRPSWASVCGSAFHTATEVSDRADFGIDLGLPLEFNDILDEMIPHLEKASGFPKSEWMISGRANKTTPNKEDETFWRTNGPAWARLYREWRRRSSWNVWITPDGEPAIEVELRWKIGEINVVGYVDRIMIDERNSLGVFDLKSGSREPSSGKQLALYAKGIASRWGEAYRPEWGTYYLARSAKLTIPSYLITYDDGRFEYEFAQSQKMIEAGNFLAYPSGLCRTCSVNRYCYTYGGEKSQEMKPYA